MSQKLYLKYSDGKGKDKNNFLQSDAQGDAFSQNNK